MIKHNEKSETKHMHEYKQNAKNSKKHADLIRQHDNCSYKSYLPADQDIKQCGENDNNTVSFSYTLIFFGGMFLEKMIQSTRDATEFFPLNGISLEDKDWAGIRSWMEMHHADTMQKL